MKINKLIYFVLVSLVWACPFKDEDLDLIDDEANFMIDQRDGTKYYIVEIGDQTWFAQNLKFNAPGSVCFENNPQNCELEGRLYTWELAKAACPIGWHLPTIEEWRTLSDFLGGTDLAGGPLKSLQGWAEPNVGATNSSGFSAFSTGFRELDGNFVSTQGIQAFFWTSTEMDQNSSYLIRLFNNSTRIVTTGGNGKNLGACIRCIKD
ncbi:MAG: fibrobacter succinogenes major paralogous domain-containing protein [Cyclobacteriaceae bacterium]|nr:fibrobacter succinogenes major paralogous domain-containing protein [Cyclobacteriaceae bacterium]MDX5468056.1 fibrobacter succinogenes major paralogous domain-containing protein [Cyclobacteriaceae bacterium]